MGPVDRFALTATACVLGAVAGLGACSAVDVPAVEPDASIDAFAGTPSIEGTPVSSFETTTCMTSVVLPLSRQLAEEADCLMPGQLVSFDAGPAIQFAGSAVLPYLSESGRASLYAAAAAGDGKVMRITSAFRSLAQQYLLRRWFELGRCGITAAAQPGRSNHESGRALDLSNYGDWRSLLLARGWTNDVPGDPVHFDHPASADLRGAGVLAFQRLWNRNAPDDPIIEDGVYGPATAERLKRAPAEGFGIGASCATRLAPPVIPDDRVEAVPCAH
jgi:N-acetylmuramoyl-L-alanine amidase